MSAVIPTNAYPGQQRPRRRQLDNGTYVLTGNAGNANGSAAVTAAAGQCRV